MVLWEIITQSNKSNSDRTAHPDTLLCPSPIFLYIEHTYMHAQNKSNASILYICPSTLQRFQLFYIYWVLSLVDSLSLQNWILFHLAVTNIGWMPESHRYGGGKDVIFDILHFRITIIKACQGRNLSRDVEEGTDA